jgi:excisionase family DNA binding protein
MDYNERNEVMTVAEAADYLRLNRQTIMRMAARGELPGVKIARRWRFKRTDIEAVLNATQDNLTDKPMPLANIIDSPPGLVGVTVISEEDGCKEEKAKPL